MLHPATAGAYPNISGATNAQYRQAPAGGVRQQAQGGQSAQAAGIRNSARPITGQQQTVQVNICRSKLTTDYAVQTKWGFLRSDNLRHNDF